MASPVDIGQQIVAAAMHSYPFNAGQLSVLPDVIGAMQDACGEFPDIDADGIAEAGQDAAGEAGDSFTYSTSTAAEEAFEAMMEEEAEEDIADMFGALGELVEEFIDFMIDN